MQQDLFAGAQAVEQRMSASHASPYDILKEERNKEKLEVETLMKYMLNLFNNTSTNNDYIIYTSSHNTA